MRKIRAYSKAMIRRVIAADLKIEMLRPLLYDTKLIDKWNNSYATHGLELLRMTLYFDVIREISAISLDRDSRSPSIHNILALLKSEELISALKKDYCKPLPKTWVGETDEESKKFWKEILREREVAEGAVRFDEHLQTAINLFEELEKSELFGKIKESRNKLIAHYEMRDDGTGARLFDPTDSGMQWSDHEDYYNKIKPIIIEIVLLTSNESYSLDSNNTQHKIIANDFWDK